MGLKKQSNWFTTEALFRAERLAFFAFIGSLLALPGCITESEIVLPAVPPKLVISSFISPEAPRVEVLVNKSAALLSPENTLTVNKVLDATVWLSDGTDSVQLGLAPDSIYVTTGLSIVPGRTYWLRATAPGGFAVSASCTVPVKVNQSLTATIDSVTIGPGFPEGNYSVKLRWQDLPGQGDFYRGDAVMQIGDPGPAGNLGSRETPYFLDETNVRDFGADGRTWQIQSDNLFRYRELQRNGSLKYLDAYLYTVDRPYFEYHKTLNQYLQNIDRYNNPMKVYSNVKGGFGIFGAYRAYSIKVPVR